MSKKKMNPGYYVARVWCHTDLKMLWKIVSRPLRSEEEAISWKGFMEITEPGYTYFVVNVDSE
jgi:hypothetical protein